MNKNKYVLLKLKENITLSDTDELVIVGKYNTKFNNILGINLPELEIYRSNGLKTHMIKRKHFKALKYINNISEIINSPDYVGINPNEEGKSLELIKVYKDNVMIGIKYDERKNYLYVSTMMDIHQSKIDRRLHSGRLKSFYFQKLTKFLIIFS